MKRARQGRAGAPATAPPFPDPRLLTVRVEAIGDVPVTEDTFIFPIDRLRLADGKVLAWHAPLMPAFYLVTAKTLLDQGESERERVLATIVPANDEPRGYADVNVKNDSLAIDAIAKIASAVILAAGGVEAYANEAIDRLEAEVTVEIERRGEKKVVPK